MILLCKSCSQTSGSENKSVLLVHSAPTEVQECKLGDGFTSNKHGDLRGPSSASHNPPGPLTAEALRMFWCMVTLKLTCFNKCVSLGMRGSTYLLALGCVHV